jgi:hypothetical protein
MALGMQSFTMVDLKHFDNMLHQVPGLDEVDESDDLTSLSIWLQLLEGEAV